MPNTTPALLLRKYAPEIALAGAPITYTLWVTNTGAASVDKLTLRDRLPVGAQVQAVAGGTVVNLSANEQQVVWTIETVAAHQAAQVQVVVTATHSLINAVYAVTTEYGYNLAGSEPILTLVSSDVNTGTVQVEGGLIQSGDEKLRVSFPPGAVITPVIITVVNASTPISGAGFGGIAFHIAAVDQAGVTVTHFAQPLTITVQYSELDLQNVDIPDEQSLNLYYWNGSQWVAILPCTGCFIDTTNNTITVVIDHLTLFALRKADRVLLPLISR